VTRFGKLPILVLLLALAAVSAALFGALHNQLSYTVGPSYFTELKFEQFAIPPDTSPRVGAALVGLVFRCTNRPAITLWAWMGVQVRRWLGSAARLRAFNLTMAVLLVASLYPLLA